MTVEYYGKFQIFEILSAPSADPFAPLAGPFKSIKKSKRHVPMSQTAGVETT